MKELNSFLNEKKNEKKKPHATKKGEGADDKKFVAMMGEYKQLSQTDPSAANELLEQIFELGRNGDVSKQIVCD